MSLNLARLTLSFYEPFTFNQYLGIVKLFLRMARFIEASAFVLVLLVVAQLAQLVFMSLCHDVALVHLFVCVAEDCTELAGLFEAWQK